MLKIFSTSSRPQIEQKHRKLFDFAISDANNNGVYDQEDIDVAIAKNKGAPSLQKIASDISASKAKVVLLGENHDSSPEEILLETANLTEKSGTETIIALELPNSVAGDVVKNFQNGNIDEKEFKNGFICSVNASPYMELHDDSFLESVADFIVRAVSLGSSIALIDNKRKPHNIIDNGTEKFFRPETKKENDERQKGLAEEIERLSKNNPRAKILCRLGYGHTMRKNVKNTGSILKERMGDGSVLSLIFTPYIGGIPGTGLSIKLLDSTVAPRKYKFDSWDHILLFDPQEKRW